MIKVGIITFQNGIKRGACDFYPLIKWKHELKDRKVEINYFSSHKEKRLFNQDVVGIDHRYYRKLSVIDNIFSDRRFIVDIMNKLRSKDIKVILFDNGDGAGGRQWDFIEHVDVLVKKQLLKDRGYYTINEGSFSHMPFAKAYDLSDQKVKKNYKSDNVPCPVDQLHKIKLGWNIGMLDYRFFPFGNYYPFGTSRLLNSIYQAPYFEDPDSERNIDSAFRGKVNKKNKNYSFQRNRVVELFEKKENKRLITGSPISKRKYLRELQDSKTCVSPFGWGEVCYRDFESIISGCLLIKPDMDHLETYPDVYKKNETYIPLKWDMSDLEKTLQDAIENYEDYKDLIINAQKIYKDAITDSSRFIDHFKTLIQ